MLFIRAQKGKIIITAMKERLLIIQNRLYPAVLLVKFVTFANREPLYTKKILVASYFSKLLFYLRIGQLLS